MGTSKPKKSFAMKVNFKCCFYTHGGLKTTMPLPVIMMWFVISIFPSQRPCQVPKTPEAYHGGGSGEPPDAKDLRITTLEMELRLLQAEKTDLENQVLDLNQQLLSQKKSPEKPDGNGLDDEGDVSDAAVRKRLARLCSRKADGTPGIAKPNIFMSSTCQFIQYPDIFKNVVLTPTPTHQGHYMVLLDHPLHHST